MNVAESALKLREDFEGYCLWRGTIDPILDPDFYPLDWLDGLIMCGNGKVWLATDAIMVTQMIHYPGGAKVIHGLIAAGSLDTIRDRLIPEAEEWARGQGATHAEIESREGWARALKDRGYALYQTTLRKAL